jgi:hypothetical protein
VDGIVAAGSKRFNRDDRVQVDVGEVDEHKDVDDDVLSRLYRRSHEREHVRGAHGRLRRLAAPFFGSKCWCDIAPALNTKTQKGK